MPTNDSFDIPSENEHPVSDESSGTLQETTSRQRCAFQAASKEIYRRSGSPTGDPASLGVEAGTLEEWSRDYRKIVQVGHFQDYQLVSNHTSEHKVFFDESKKRAFKHTWPGVFGQIPCVVKGHLDRRNATPSEYLQRMALQLEVFGGDIELEGVYTSDEPSMIIGQPAGQPSLVISQKWYEQSGAVTTESIHDLLAHEGFRGVPNSYFGFYRPSDGVAIVDAKPDNFVQTTEGLIPIDLQMTIFTPEQLRDANLTSDGTEPVIFIPRG